MKRGEDISNVEFIEIKETLSADVSTPSVVDASPGDDSDNEVSSTKIAIKGFLSV